NGSGCGPPRGVTLASAWPWLDHPVSGLHPPTQSPCSDSLSLRLPYTVKLAGERKSLTHYTKGTPSSQLNRSSQFLRNLLRILLRNSLRILQDLLLQSGLLARALRAPKNLIEGRLSWDSDCLYACGFRIYCTPLPGFFSPFPHGTGSLSVDHEYLALEDGPPMFRQDFTCPALLVARLVPQQSFRLRGSHPLWPPLPGPSARSIATSCRLLPFRSPLLWESRLLSVPPGTEMFQFSGLAPRHLWIQ